MGGLFSCCCGEEEEAGGDAGERTRLIRWRHTFLLFGPLSFFRTGDKLIQLMIGLKFPMFNSLHSDGPGHGGTLVPDGLHCEGRDGLGGLAQVLMIYICVAYSSLC